MSKSLLDDVPAEYRDNLRGLLELSDEDLWAASRTSMDPRTWRRHEALLHRNAETPLTGDERRELEHLQAEMDRLVYRKSFAMALLRQRGHDLSPLIAGTGDADA